MSGGIKSLRDYGPAETFFRALYRLQIVSAVHSLDFYINLLNVQGSVVRVFKADGFPEALCEFRELTSESSKEFLFHKSIGSSDWIAEQFRRGSRLFAAVLGRTVIATTWIHLRYAELTYVNRAAVAMPKNVAYSHGAVTAPEFREKKIGSLLRKFVFDALAREGFKFVTGAIFLENGPAKRLQCSVGSGYWGRITYLRWNGRDYWVKFLTPEGKKQPDLFDHVVSKPVWDATPPVRGETMAGMVL